MMDSSLHVDRIFASMISDLQEGNFVAGQRIRDRDIADAFGVSRTPAREAIGRLHSRGLLEVRSGRLVIRTLSPGEVVELYSARRILEGSVARFAAQHASDPELSGIERLLTAFESEMGNPKEQARINRKLHAAIREAAHNRFLAGTLDDLDVTLSLLPGTTYESSDRVRQVSVEHRNILAAIKSRDPDAADAAARLHIQQAQQARLSARLSAV